MATCALCGRPTTPYVWIGNSALGPKCAKKLNLSPSAKFPKASAVRFSKRARKEAERIPVTMDLFEGLDMQEAR